ncbi:transposase [Qipengyuania sp. 6B39]|uniref:transposase n=1 Tax=Qipengyuania proteolytica TaxID=2867239 RepID=UPI001C896EA2|nr:transposase [Qipengyuania proteolytica]MBX7495585.1 transposase [Qipengyuania proteolytica]
MPRVIENRANRATTLDEVIDSLGDGFDPRDEKSADEAAQLLGRLGRNPDFLGDLLIERLRERHRQDYDALGYGPQAIVLSPLRGTSFLRANIWPSESEACFAASGAKSFVYGIPHDHNFDFLSVGYFGPGYRSDYYEYDYEAVDGYVGETAQLRFIERSALHEGRLMHYRAHCDIHSQLPPEAMSVSLNIMHIAAGQGWFDQYGFDLDSCAVTGVLNPTSTEVFLRCAVGMGGVAALELAEDFGLHHPSDRLRLASYEARAGLANTPDESDALWREAELSGSNLLAREAMARRRAIAA